MPSSFHIRTPCRPSAPPVSQLALLAASCEQQAEAERDHDQREVAEAGDDEAREIAEHAGRGGRDHQAR